MEVQNTQTVATEEPKVKFAVFLLILIKDK